MLTLLIFDVFEDELIKRIINEEYFYFNQFERNQILNNTIYDLYDEEESLYPKDKAFDLLLNDFYEYLKENKSIVLKGFVTFRIKNYIEILSDQIDKSVNKFIVEREYTEFISLLKMYVSNEPNHADLVNLIYNSKNPILLDKNSNKIELDTDNLNAKYLSDISFSSNDYILNTLLNLNPKKIYVYFTDKKADEFINTLKLVFEDDVVFCENNFYVNFCQKA